jgi:glycosyltransferase involved in cell wall biosynthesis
MAQTWVELAHELGASDVVVIPHVLPAELDARLSRVALRRRRDRSDHSNPVFLYYGRWAESKGVDILADALRRIGDLAPEPELRVFGNGDRKWLEHCFDDVRSARVHLGAWLSDDDKLRELEIATALVYPSRVEAFGQTLLEAMRAGVPIITTEAGAIPEVVTGYPLALMVPPGDSSALAAALRDVIEHRWPPEPTGDSFERTSRSEVVALIGALYERLSTKRSHHAA